MAALERDTEVEGLWRRVQEQNRQIETLRAQYAHQAMKAQGLANRVKELETMLQQQEKL